MPIAADAIASEDPAELMRGINAIEAVTFIKGSALSMGRPKVTPGGFLHVDVSGTRQVLDPSDGTFIAQYSTVGEILSDWGQNGDIWSHTSTVDGDEATFTLHSYSEDDGATGSTVVLDAHEFTGNFLGLAMGGASGSRIYICTILHPSEIVRVSRFSSNGSFIGEEDHSGDYPGEAGDGQEAFRASKFDNHYYVMENGGTWHEWDEDGDAVGAYNSNMSGSNGSSTDSADQTHFMHGMSQNEAGAWAFLERGGGFITLDEDGDVLAGFGPAGGDQVALHANPAVEEVFITDDDEIKVYDSQDGTLLRTLETFSYTPYTPQTTFYRYPTTTIGDKVSAGTPDGGSSVPADSFFEGNIIRGNEWHDMHEALEGVAIHWKNDVTGNPWNFTGSSADNILNAAVGHDDWDHATAAAFNGEAISVDDWDEINGVLILLAASDAV